MITINGAQGEGGGQILRTSLALAMIQNQPITITHIRAGRRKPGLAPQHLAGVKAAAQLSNAIVDGAAIGAQTLQFTPRMPVQPGKYVFDVSALSGQPSAGAITLLLQAIWLPLALSEGDSQLILRGGTHVSWSPPVHYVQWVLAPALSRLGVDLSIQLNEWGWYPQGGGQVTLRIAGETNLTGVDFGQRGNLVAVKGASIGCNLPAHIPQRIASRANNLLSEARIPADVQPRRVRGRSTGAGLFIAAEYEHTIAGFSTLGARGMPSDQVATQVVEQLLAHHRLPNALDQYLPDQLILPLALAEGESTLSTIKLTQHTLTNIAVIQQFIDRRILVDGQLGDAGTVHIS